MPEEQWKRYYGLPHILHYRAICAFDTTSNSVDPQHFEEAIVSVAFKAIETMNEAISGRNAQDFYDEMEIHWGNKSTVGLSCVSFVDKWPSKATAMRMFHMRLDAKATFGICRKSDLAKYVRLSISRQFSDSDKLKDLIEFDDFSYDCLYVPFDAPIPYPLRETVREWHKIIASCTKFAERYEKYLVSDRSKSKYIVCGLVKPDGGKTVMAFRHPGVPEKFKGSFSEAIDGAYGFKKIEFMRVDDVSQRRLFSRGGTGDVFDVKACMVGCGSLGGHLAVALMDSGVTEFQLVDFDTVSYANIARHTCGHESLGTNKVDALKTRIEQHNPNCACDAHAVNATSLLSEGNKVLSKADAVFITAADLPLESEFVRAKIDGKLDKPLIIAWMEPYSLAAHALVLNKPQDIYSTGLFDSQMEFSKRVVKNSARLYKRDSGCNATYMPYSGLDTQAFSIALVRKLFDEFLPNSDSNYHFAWIGALSKASKYGAKISPLWADCSDYRTFTEVIS